MPVSANSIYEQFENVCREFPDKPALVYLGRTFTYSELIQTAETMAAHLHRLGVAKGDRAILYLSNSPQWVLSWLALLRIGAVAIPISPIYTPVDLKYMANDSESETIFCMDTNFGYVTQVLPETGLKRAIVTNVADLLPWWKRWIGNGFSKIPSGKGASGENIVPFKKLLKNGDIVSLPSPKTRSEEIFEMLYTGGTTGLPKGVPYSNILFLESASEQRAMSERFIPKGTDIVIQGGPLFHILGQAVGLGALLSGDTLVLLPQDQSGRSFRPHRKIEGADRLRRSDDVSHDSGA